MPEDFNLFFGSKLDAKGGNATIKRYLPKPRMFLAKLIELKENYDLCDIWRLRNTKSKRFTFAQTHSSGFINVDLTTCFMFISNIVHEFVTMTDNDSYFNIFSCTVLSFKRNRLSQM